MFFVTPPRLELGTPSLKVKCSSQLSYEVNFVIRTGFEPVSSFSGWNNLIASNIPPPDYLKTSLEF